MVKDDTMPWNKACNLVLNPELARIAEQPASRSPSLDRTTLAVEAIVF